MSQTWDDDLAAEEVRSAELLAAQEKAEALFAAIVERGLLRPGVGEREVSDTVRDLAHDLFGVERHWHKRVVRAGENTLTVFRDNPPDRVIAEDDIVYVDLGPIFSAWEADFGRTFVLGDDPVKHRLVETLPQVWDAGRDAFRADADITGEQLYAQVVGIAETAGWTFGGAIAGHLVGEFPHDVVRGDEIHSYVAPGSNRPMRRLDSAGRRCHWILEVHLVDRARGIGGFHEQLLDL